MTEIKRREDEIKQQQSRLEQQQLVLLDYVGWMNNVERGQSVLKDSPEDLEGLEVPDWTGIRPDAIGKLQPGWE